MRRATNARLERTATAAAQAGLRKRGNKVVVRIIRALLGFASAAIAGGLTLVLFVMTPRELVSLPSGALVEGFAHAGLLALTATASIALFGAPFALLAATLGEARRFKGIAYYAMMGLLAGLSGFATRYLDEPGSEPGPASTYALGAFAATGLVAGLVSWLMAGRFAGSADARAARTAAAPNPAMPAATKARPH